MLSDKDRAIIAQTSGKIAGQLLQGAGLAAIVDGSYYSVVEAVYCDIVDRATDAEQAISAARHPSSATAIVTDAFTTATAAPVPVPGPAPALAAVTPIAQGAHTPGPVTVIHANSNNVEKLEDALYHNPANWKSWIDSDKSTVNGGPAPDLTHEHIAGKNPNFKVGIFLVDTKHGKAAPEWAFKLLGKEAAYAELIASGKVTA